jgi:hypothetical protein
MKEYSSEEIAAIKWAAYQAGRAWRAKYLGAKSQGGSKVAAPGKGGRPRNPPSTRGIPSGAGKGNDPPCK